MAPPLLYGIDMSPPVRSVLLTAKAIGLQLEMKEMKLDGDHLSPEFLKLNIQHTIPTLDDNGFVIWDSHAIMAYLINKYAKGSSLYPEDSQKRAIIDQRLYFNSGVAFPVLITTAKPIRLKQTKIVPEEKKVAAEEAYYYLNHFLDGKEWVAGEELTIADLSLIATVTTMNLFFPIKNYPNITAWIKRCEALPYYDINQVGVDNFNTALQNLIKD